MKRFLVFLGLALYLAGFGSPQAKGAGYAIGVKDGPDRELSVVRGKVLFVRPSEQGFNWDLSKPVLPKRTDTTEIQFASGGRWHGWYLRFDPKGKDPTVTLSKKEGLGTQWTLTKAGGVSIYSIQATKGKFKGWYLTLGKGEKRVDRNGKEYTAYRATLSPKPMRLPKFDISEVSN